MDQELCSQPVQWEKRAPSFLVSFHLLQCRGKLSKSTSRAVVESWSSLLYSRLPEVSLNQSCSHKLLQKDPCTTRTKRKRSWK